MSGPEKNEKPQPAAEMTALLNAAAGGDSIAVEKLFAAIYDQLHALASKHMLAERLDHTLQPTALVHETYLRLVKLNEITWQSRAHFFTAAAEAMRRVLVDHARKCGAVKRGGDWKAVSLNLADLVSKEAMGELLAINEALEQLDAHDQTATQIVRLRFFAGMGIDEIAEALSMSPRSVDREWSYARTWLRARLLEDRPETGGTAGGQP